MGWKKAMRLKAEGINESNFIMILGGRIQTSYDSDTFDVSFYIRSESKGRAQDGINRAIKRICELTDNCFESYKETLTGDGPVWFLTIGMQGQFCHPEGTYWRI